MTDILPLVGNGAVRLEPVRERLLCRHRDEPQLQRWHLIRDGLLEANVNNFLFQQETEGGWVFAKHVNSDMFLFGPTLSDVIQQATDAENFLKHARQLDSGMSGNATRVVAPRWEQLEIA